VKDRRRGRDLLPRKNSRVLVTGGAGFIGSHLVDKLAELNHEVTILDNLYTGRMENIEKHMQNKNVHFVKGDIRNFKSVKECVNNVDAVFNLAAIISVPLSIKNPLLTNDVNVAGTMNLLKASLDSNIKRFIQASSAAIYGDAKILPVREDFAPKPLSPYAASKLSAEAYAMAFHEAYGLETVCLRYFNVYGPRQMFNPYSGVITIFVSELLHDRPPKIFGDGRQTRDFVFIEDVISASMLALTKKSAVGEAFNISTSNAITVNKLVRILQKIMGKSDLKPIYEEPRSGDIRHSCASIEKARSLLGYEPKFSLDKGLKELVRYMTEQ
jgi:UDP-glucose 4-epimerase